jgi:hypothetical protein
LLAVVVISGDEPQNDVDVANYIEKELHVYYYEVRIRRRDFRRYEDKKEQKHRNHEHFPQKTRLAERVDHVRAVVEVVLLFCVHLRCRFEDVFAFGNVRTDGSPFPQLPTQ